jgi:hypothetical protein
VADAHFRVALDVVRDLHRRAGEGAALSIGEKLGLFIVVPVCRIREIDAGGIATRFLRMAPDLGGNLGELRRSLQEDVRVVREGIPSIGELSGPAQRRRTFATGPYGWMRLLHGFGANTILSKRQ